MAENMAQPQKIDDAEILRIQAIVDEDGPLTDEEAAVMAVFEPKRETSTDHYANLAEDLEESELSSIAKDVVQWYDWDDDSRADWKRRESKGIMMLGVTERTEGGADFKGASRVVHPLLMEACTQFQARAIAEIWPSGGPVKGLVLGEVTEELEDQKDRVVGYMNYQYTTEMPGAFETEDNLLFRLPLSGSCFTKVYRDPLNGGLMRQFIDPNYFVCPYGASDLRSAPRYTHTFYESPNTVRKKQVKKFYRDCTLSAPVEDADTGATTQEVRDTIDNADGHSQVNTVDDQRHTMLEMHVDLNLPGFEDIGEDGNPTGIALPYVVTVERGSYKVLSIYRNWREGDEQKEKRIHFTHRRFLPGLGFYGFGFLHAIGGLARAATGALRALLDAAAFANQQGGFRSRDAKLPAGDVKIGPGDWPEVESTAEELSKAFFRLPYTEPSMTLYHLLGSLDDLGRRFASTTENMVGEGNNTGPVGTTVALIEQGMKLFSSIHKRQHIALGEEFNIVAELNGEELPGGQDEYPYNVPGESRSVKLSDFDERIDVQPVSDPNMVSSAQRIATAQAVLQLSDSAPDLYDRKEAHKQMLNALRVPDPESVLPDKTSISRMGPVEENISMMSGMPIKAFIEQDHQSHQMVHESWFNGLPPEMQQAQAHIYQTHQAEHLAQLYLLQMQQMMGGELPALQMFSSEYDSKEGLPELPVETENQVAMMVAAAVQKAMEAQQANQPPSPEQMAIEAEQARKDEIAQREQDRKDEDADWEQERKDEIADKEQARKDKLFFAEQARAEEKLQAELRAIEEAAEAKEDSREGNE